MEEEEINEQEDGKDVFDLLDDIVFLAKDARRDVEKTIKGGKAASLRVRQRMFDVRNIAIEIREWAAKEIENNGIVYTNNNAKHPRASKEINLKHVKEKNDQLGEI